MSNQINIEKMSLAEKIELMEELWKTISTSTDYSPPSWHKGELKKRMLAVSEGKAVYTDWKQAKKEIRREIYNDPDS